MNAGVPSRTLVAVPVLDRPTRAAPLAASLAGSLEDELAMMLFLCSPGDDEQIKACRDVAAAYPDDTFDEDFTVAVEVVPWPCGPGDWARKQNLAVNWARDRSCDYLFTGADDLCFCPGWLDRAVQCAELSGAGVIGTNDLGNSRVVVGDHSTHSLVAVSYPAEFGTIDEPESGKLFHEGYDHQFCDDEMVQTAKVRRQFHACLNAEVPHLHPHWGKGRDDATYQKGMAHFWDDSRLFEARKDMWLGPNSPVYSTWK